MAEGRLGVGEHIFYFFSSAFCFSCCYLFFQWFSQKYCSHVVQGMDIKARLEWIGNCVAFLHGIVSTIGASYAIFCATYVIPSSADVPTFSASSLSAAGSSSFSPNAVSNLGLTLTEYEEGVMVYYGYSWAVSVVLFITEGYLLYDTLVYLFYWKILVGRKEIAFLFHHAMGIAGIAYCLHYTIGYYLCACFIFYEVSTPFLYCIYFSKELGYEGSPFHKTSGLLFYLSFFLGRIVMSLYILSEVYWLRRFIVFAMPEGSSVAVVYGMSFGVPTLFLLLNCYWFALITQQIVAELNKSNASSMVILEGFEEAQEEQEEQKAKRGERRREINGYSDKGYYYKMERGDLQR
ncbi:hypothetical protein QOT17_008349 [Balamuthia mandrillaris]